MAAENLTRRCCDCHCDLSLDSFYIHLRKPRGLKSRARRYFSSRCKGCSKLAAKNWLQNNKAKAQAWFVDYRAAHKVETFQRNKTYRERNKERLRASKAAYYQRPDVKQRQVDRNRVARQSDPKKASAYSTKWRLAHPEVRRASSKSNKVKRRQSSGTCTPEQWIAKCAYWGWRCYLCGQNLTSSTLHMEHRKPLSRGGSHWPANLAPACEKCNLSKSNKTEAEYRAITTPLPLAGGIFSRPYRRQLVSVLRDRQMRTG